MSRSLRDAAGLHEVYILMAAVSVLLVSRSLRDAAGLHEVYIVELL